MKLLFCLLSICLLTQGSGYGSSRQTKYDFHSQASQDAFVYTLLYDIEKKKDQGYYLDIGAAHPIIISNTYFFEKYFHWKGISIDVSPDYTNAWAATRNNPLLNEDATKINYRSILESFPFIIDYLSLDVDGQYDTVLQQIPFDQYLFKIITIEHDYYRFGDFYRKNERDILQAKGYYLLCPDVSHPDVGSFEDWWIHPSGFSEKTLLQLIFLDLKEKNHDEIVSLLKNLAF